MQAISNSQIQQVIQLMAKNIYLNDKIPINNIPDVKLLANFWLKFFIFIIISIIWIILFPIDKITNPLIKSIIIFLPITATFLLVIQIIEKKHLLEINDKYIQYKSKKIFLDDIFHIYQHPLFKSKVSVYHIRKKDNFLTFTRFSLRNEAEAYYFVRKIEEYKLKKQFIK